jgi:hypothetical protein
MLGQKNAISYLWDTALSYKTTEIRKVEQGCICAWPNVSDF